MQIKTILLAILDKTRRTPPEINIFTPFTTKSSPSRTAVVATFATSDPPLAYGGGCSAGMKRSVARAREPKMTSSKMSQNVVNFLKLVCKFLQRTLTHCGFAEDSDSRSIQNEVLMNPRLRPALT